jgi:hypothetical protein
MAWRDGGCCVDGPWDKDMTITYGPRNGDPSKVGSRGRLQAPPLAQRPRPEGCLRRDDLGPGNNGVGKFGRSLVNQRDPEPGDFVYRAVLKPARPCGVCRGLGRVLDGVNGAKGITPCHAGCVNGRVPVA